MVHAVERGPYRSADPKPPTSPGLGWPEIIFIFMFSTYLTVYCMPSVWSRVGSDTAESHVDATVPTCVTSPSYRVVVMVLVIRPRLPHVNHALVAVCSHSLACGCGQPVVLPLCPPLN
jgi:hypothetical protein